MKSISEALKAAAPAAYGNLDPEFHDSNRRLFVDKAAAAKYHKDCYDLTDLYTIEQIEAADAEVAKDEESHEDLRKAYALLFAENAKLRDAHNPAVAAIEFALRTDCMKEFLHCWMHGDFDVIRREWPEAPEDIFIDADPLLEDRSHDYPECSGDPTSCPENEGRGCCNQKPADSLTAPAAPVEDGRACELCSGFGTYEDNGVMVRCYRNHTNDPR